MHIASPLSKAAGLGVALLAAGSALAMGLGEASGRAVLGQPLHLEIPILGGSGSAPAKACFSLRAPRAEVGNEFAVRSGRIEIIGQGNTAKVIVTTTQAVTEPVVGFTIAAGCNIGLSRDYVLLVRLPSTTEPAVEPLRAAPPAEPAQAANTPAQKGVPAGEGLRIGAAVTLEGLARQKYPMQPKARAKFMRMMMEANAGLASGDVPIAAGTELREPPGLPLRRVGPYRGEDKAAPPARKSAPAASAKLPVRAAKDRLVLGTAPESRESKLLAEAERLTSVLMEQNKAQEKLVAKIGNLDASYVDLSKRFLDLQTRLARIETERAAEKAATENSRFSQVFELLLAVLAGGTIGGVALHLFPRHRTLADAGFGSAEEDNTPPAAASVPPWLEKAAPTGNTTGTPAVAPNTADQQPVAPAQPASLLSATTAAAATTPVAAAVSEPAAMLETPPAQPEVQAEVPTVIEPLKFSSVSLTDQEIALAPAHGQGTESSAPPEVAAPQEVLALDFPEISIPGTEDRGTLDFHKP